MKKHGVVFSITIIIEIFLTYLVASTFSVRFIELMFFTGIAFTVIVFLFSSSGGTVTKLIDSQNSARTGLIQKPQELKFTTNPVFQASLTFFVIGLMFFILLITSIIPPSR